MIVRALDCETDLATNDQPIPTLVSLSSATSDRQLTLQTPWDTLTPALVSGWFEDHTVWHGGVFDLFVLLRWAPTLEPAIVSALAEGRVHFTDTREKLLDNVGGRMFGAGKYDLGSVALRRAGLVIDKQDPWRKRYRELIGVPADRWPAEARSYALYDAGATLAVFERQAEAAEALLWDPFAPAPWIVRKDVALYASTLRGIWTDPEQTERLARDLDTQIAEAEQELLKAGLARVEGKRAPKVVCNTKAAQHAMALWCGQQGLAIPTTAKGGVGLSEDHMIKVGIPPNHPLARYRRLKGLRTTRTKIVPVFRRPIVRTRYDACKDTARTGSSGPQGKTRLAALSYTEWVGSNFQNLPQAEGYRECMQARPGHVLVVSDYGGQEQVTNAQNQLDALGRSPLAEALQQGVDTHSKIAAEFLGIPLSSFDREKPEHESMRKLAKIWNFGRWGGMGDMTFQRNLRRKGIDWSLGKVREFNGTWKRVWEADHYFNWVKRQPQTMTQFGPRYLMRHPRSGFIKGGCSYTEACNFPFQHLAAMMTGDALWFAWLEARKRGVWPTDLWLMVHDELVSEVPEAEAPEQIEHQEDCMLYAAKLWCPDVPISINTKVMRNYHK